MSRLHPTLVSLIRTMPLYSLMINNLPALQWRTKTLSSKGIRPTASGSISFSTRQTSNTPSHTLNPALNPSVVILSEITSDGKTYSIPFTVPVPVSTSLVFVPFTFTTTQILSVVAPQTTSATPSTTPSPVAKGSTITLWIPPAESTQSGNPIPVVPSTVTVTKRAEELWTPKALGLPDNADSGPISYCPAGTLCLEAGPLELPGNVHIQPPTMVRRDDWIPHDEDGACPEGYHGCWTKCCSNRGLPPRLDPSDDWVADAAS